MFTSTSGYEHCIGVQRLPVEALCGELSTGEYHAQSQYERSSGWVWTGGLEARQGVGTQDWGSRAPYTTLKQNSNLKPSSNPHAETEGRLNASAWPASGPPGTRVAVKSV